MKWAAASWDRSLDSPALAARRLVDELEPEAGKRIPLRALYRRFLDLRGVSGLPLPPRVPMHFVSLLRPHLEDKARRPVELGTGLGPPGGSRSVRCLLGWRWRHDGSAPRGAEPVDAAMGADSSPGSAGPKP